ncbi:hypothetical protein B0H17DRAFT_1002960 [Mycena rosella]|uniref:Uncharacterized protein n=1 Tax=Mycena rosella TaxID=1033263 RepID=A0AAD7M774_MYCRO|nr:hypothetical protein B0H17DRAFT_1002960 [Mycena rosella]
MGKRKRVPAALHSELSEYNSLLRVLRTNDTLDLTKHITLSPPRRPRHTAQASSSKPDAPQVDEQDDGDDDEPPAKRGRPRKRDTWTRWPLLVNDVHVPEWGLEDEIGALVTLCLRNNPPKIPQYAKSAQVEDGDEGDADEDDEDPPPILPHLAQSASAFLASILALLALHTPARPQSMQNRLKPIGWQTVLDVLASCAEPAHPNSLIDPAMISNVKTRMEAIYGPCESHAPLRAALKYTSHAAARLEEADVALFSCAQPTRRQPKQRSEKRAPVVEEDVDSDDLDG